MVQINMACYDTLVAVQHHFGVGRVVPQKTYPGKKQQWKWRVSYRDARMVVARVYPYLITKRIAAEKLLAHIPLQPGTGPRNKSRPPV